MSSNFILPTEAEPYRLIRGEALAELAKMPSGSVDAVLADVPYSSGGFTRSDRNQTPAAKYQQSGTTKTYGDFSGDCRDQRSYRYWCQLWLSECLRIVRPGGYCLTFSDWRQIGTTIDALQAGGFVYRGIVAWDKGRAARAPHKGYFRHQAEYVVWGSRGVLTPAVHAGPWPGVIQCPVLQRDKHHVTGKPTALMEQLVEIVPPGGIVLDPFAGSGTTLVAAIRQGRRAIGIELDQHYHDVALRRCQEAVEASRSQEKTAA